MIGNIWTVRRLRKKTLEFLVDWVWGPPHRCLPYRWGHRPGCSPGPRKETRAHGVPYLPPHSTAEGAASGGWVIHPTLFQRVIRGKGRGVKRSSGDTLQGSWVAICSCMFWVPLKYFPSVIYRMDKWQVLWYHTVFNILSRHEKECMYMYNWIPLLYRQKLTPHWTSAILQ